MSKQIKGTKYPQDPNIQKVHSGNLTLHLQQAIPCFTETKKMFIIMYHRLQYTNANEWLFLSTFCYDHSQT